MGCGMCHFAATASRYGLPALCALAAFLHADLCRIYTDVDGVYDRDQRLHPDAVKYGRISYDDMLLLARGGARVLHDRCVELARREHVVLEVCSAFSDAPGTIVG